MTGAPHPAIRTPDQRIRVFVSSTLRELADERSAARAAIERMRLAPVMFELGARPHPPRELYRSYLQQCDIFVGIYWESYGWVAPGEEISGLQDEYDLAPDGMPKLIYIKASDHREERLTQFIAGIRSDDTAAYLPFQTAEELGARLGDDLATLLAERFDQSRLDDDPETSPASLASRIPVPYTATIGRERDLAAVRGLLESRAGRLISLVGPGGIGKSRIAIEIANAASDLFEDGVFFVPLEGVFETGLLLPTIAYVLGVRDTGEELEERISHALSGKRVLIVLDNFEQIVEAAPLLVRLFTVAPTATFLVTSRMLLRIRGERVYEVEALRSPDEGQPTNVERAMKTSAVALFVDRAHAANPGFLLTEDNVAAVADLCRRLDGLPLAIELAAARARMLTPREMAERLEHSLPLLDMAARDLPERHRTMTAAIEWSVGLLAEVHRDLLEDLGVFARRFSLEAVEAVGAGRSWGDDTIDALSALVDASLVQQTEIEGNATFSLLAIVREYAVGRLTARGDLDALRIAHAEYYAGFVAELAPSLRDAGQVDAVGRLELELPNLRAAVRHLVAADRLDEAGDFAWNLLVYWWISGFFSEVRLWMLELVAKGRPLSAHTRAVAEFFTLWGQMWRQPPGEVVAGLGEAVRLFAESGDADGAAMALAAKAITRMQAPGLDIPVAEAELREAGDQLHALGNGWAEGMAEVGLGLLAMMRGGLEDARARFDRAVELSEEGEDTFTRTVAGNQRARLMLLAGDAAAAEEEYRTTLSLGALLHFDEAVAYALEGVCAIAAARGEAFRAGALAVVAASIRQRIGVFDVEGFEVHVGPLNALRATDPGGVAEGERAGADLGVADAVLLALPAADPEVREVLARW